MKLLIIDDNKALSRSLSMTLSTYGFACDEASKGIEGMKMAQENNYDAIIVDLMLTDIDGYQILLRLRALRIKVPILIISGLSSPEQKIRGLQSGADDYLTKPFDHHELVARLKTICRRTKGGTQSAIQFDEVVINLDNPTVTVAGQEISLTPTEYSILVLLAERKGTVVTKEVVHRHLYKGVVEPRSKVVDVFICKLRDKLKKASGGKEYIGTVWGRGYILRHNLDNDAEPGNLELAQDIDNPQKDSEF